MSTSPSAFNLCQHRYLSKQCSLHIRWPSIGASALASVLPKNIQHWFPLGWTGLILQSKGLSRVQHHNSKASILWCSAIFMVQLSHLYVTTGRTIALTIQMKVKVLVTQSCPTLCDLTRPTPLSMGFSRQEYWSELPVPSPGGLPNPGIVGVFFTIWATKTIQICGCKRTIWEDVLHIDNYRQYYYVGCNTAKY